MHISSPPVPHLSDHENDENEDAEDWYGQELDACLEHCADLHKGRVKETVTGELRLELNECK